MSKYNFDKVKINQPVYYGKYSTEKHRLLCSAAISYSKRHGWEDFLTRKDKKNNKLMLIRLK